MLGDVFASLAAGFAETFGAPFEDATVRWPGTPVVDAGGSITTPATPVTKSCKVQFDAPTEAMRADPGFLSTDSRVLVLAATLSGTLDTSARIVVAAGANAGTWKLETCLRDPAGIGYECRARRVAA